MFSVIIPTRNRPQFLDAAVASVLAQEDATFELIIVNDGEGPVDLPHDHRIRILDNQGRGAVPARNLGVASAFGKYIAFLDDDDVWTCARHLPQAQQAMVEGAAFTFANGMMRFEDGSPPRAFARDASATTLAHDNTILISAVCYKRSLHAQLGAFDEALPYYWDWDWYLRVARTGARLAHINKTVVDIRVHAQNMSGEGNASARKANLVALAAKHRLGPLALKNHMDFV